jgi:hypothetical protein
MIVQVKATICCVLICNSISFPECPNIQETILCSKKSAWNVSGAIFSRHFEYQIVINAWNHIVLKGEMMENKLDSIMLVQFL